MRHIPPQGWHPVVAGVRGERLVRLRIKIRHAAVNGDLTGDDVVAARVIFVMKPAKAFVIAVSRVANGVAGLFCQTRK